LDDIRALADNFSAGFFPADIDLSQNGSLRVLEVAASSIVGGEPGFLAHVVSISKSWKVRYSLATLMTGPLPRQGLIMKYMPLSVPWAAIITECMPLPVLHVNIIIQYRSQYNM